MLALKYLLITGGLAMIIAAVCILTYDLYREMLYRLSLIHISSHGLEQAEFCARGAQGRQFDAGAVRGHAANDPALSLIHI